MMKLIDACKKRFPYFSKEKESESIEYSKEKLEYMERLYSITYNPFLEYDKAKREAAERKRLREVKNLRKKKTFPKMKRRMARTKREVGRYI